MKTTGKRNQDSSKPIVLITLIILIVFGQVLLEMRSNKVDNYSAKVNKVKPINFVEQTFSHPKLDHSLELGKIASQVTLREQNSARGKEKNENHGNLSFAKMNAFLNVETEPKLDLQDVMSIEFPEIEEDNFSRLQERDIELYAMKTEIKPKADSTESFNALALLVREYLIIEKETPLKLETWMIDTKGWYPKKEEKLSLALYK